MSRWRVLAPGRVNLIGEHTDYNGLPVLPMAIDRAIRVDFRVSGEATVRLDSPEDRFERCEFRLDDPIEAAAQGDWSNYVRAAALGLGEHGVELRRGIEGTVAGDVPIAAGLASSSALVVASALALLKANEVEIPRIELAALMARAERFVGLQGGGMDQAACLHGVAGHAMHIEFEPLRVTPVAVPMWWRWVVASSLVRAEKSRGVLEAYNERAGQCREALEGLADGGGEAAGGGDGWETRDVRGGGAAGRPTYRDLVADHDLDGVLRRARDVLSPLLFRRFRHVVMEGPRVALAEEAMRNGEMDRFGDLMVQSQDSLRDDYEASTAELDEMVEIALKAGATGARLTGAGFGGCIVALCETRAVAPVMRALATRFYAPRLGGPPRRDVMFAAKPARGAWVG
ncbi:MAG: galactokinase [Gemmatimonadota bacterium]|nr:galactokinase [Gemmatimonadota bacterium]